jgi:uncharacterized membrane protein YvbJ
MYTRKNGNMVRENFYQVKGSVGTINDSKNNLKNNKFLLIGLIVLICLLVIAYFLFFRKSPSNKQQESFGINIYRV